MSHENITAKQGELIQCKVPEATIWAVCVYRRVPGDTMARWRLKDWFYDQNVALQLAESLDTCVVKLVQIDL